MTLKSVAELKAQMIAENEADIKRLRKQRDVFSRPGAYIGWGGQNCTAEHLSNIDRQMADLSQLNKMISAGQLG